MKKKAITLFLSCVFLTNIHGQADVLLEQRIKDSERRLLESRIKSTFLGWWLDFRLQYNPLKSNEDKFQNGLKRDPFDILLPHEFTIEHLADIKVLPWYDEKVNSSLGYIHFNPNGFYIVEKGDGITGIRWDFFTFPDITPLDTVHASVYDSIFPFDNRFLIFMPGIDKGPMYFFSGNVQWDDWRVLNMGRRPDLPSVAYIRGVQFGLQRLKKIPDDWIEDVRENFPEYSGWDFAHADMSFLTHGSLLITSPPNRAIEHLEFIFFSDDPRKTGDEEWVYYEYRYILPTSIKSISERRMEKRKLTREEIEKLKNTNLKFFIDTWRRFIIEEEIDAIEE